MEKLSYEKIQENMKDLDNWNSDDSKISREFKFTNFKKALDFTNKIGEKAEEKQHHPDITLKYGYVKVELTSHEQGGITEKDFSLAKKIDNIYSSFEKNSENSEKNVKILMKEYITHDVIRFVLEKPEGYEFTPGQATDVSINLSGWEKEKRPFTFTSLNEDKVLEFVIKIYPEHEGVTKKLSELNPGDELIIDSPWGTINYQGRGSRGSNGVFIAGGAGITPFIAILRDLYKNKGGKEKNKLLFSNKTSKDIILEREFQKIFEDNPENLIFTLTRENKQGYENKRIDKEFLKENISDFNQNFYICGPEEFTKEISGYLKELGAKPDSLVFEK